MSQGRLSPSQLAEVLQIHVPSAAVGAIIGSGGANIKQIIRDSGAFVTVSEVCFHCLTFAFRHELKSTRG